MGADLEFSYLLLPPVGEGLYVNVVNKPGYSGEVIKSYVQGKRLEITRVTISTLLGVRNDGPPVDLKKEFYPLDKQWEVRFALVRFGKEMEYTQTKQKATIKANTFEHCRHLIIYLFVHNVITKKSGLNEVQNNDLYFLDRMFHDRESPFAPIPLPNVIMSYLRATARCDTTNYTFHFPHLLSFLFEQFEVNLDGVEQVPKKSLYKINYYILKDLGITFDNIPNPRDVPALGSSQMEEEPLGYAFQDIGEAVPSTLAPPYQRSIWDRVMVAIRYLDVRVNEGFDTVDARIDPLNIRMRHMESGLDFPPRRSPSLDEHGDDRKGGSNQGA